MKIYLVLKKKKKSLKKDTRRRGYEERKNKKLIKALKPPIQSLTLNNLILVMKGLLARIHINIYIGYAHKGRRMSSRF